MTTNPHPHSSSTRHAPLPRDHLSQLIDEAIRSKKLLSFRYKGHPRIVEPHILGTLTTGRVALSCYQVRGTSSSGMLEWKNCKLDEMHELALLGERFTRPRAGYNPLDDSFATVFSQL